ncbi:MAG: hypothetical protein ABIZ81_04505 [Opitutaceae bacterium]
MSWTSSFFVAGLSGVVGLVVAGLVTSACSEWLHVSNREGAAGYLMIAMALVGGAVAFGLGLVVSRGIAGMADPGFFKALGISCGAVVALGGVALGLAWLKADFAPKIDDRSLELAIEVRAPSGFTLPETADEYGSYACVRVPGTGRYQQQGKLDLTHARQENGYWIVTAVVPLHTSSANKVMDVRFSQEQSLTFGLPLRSHPGRVDMEWSKWVDSAWDAGTAEPPPEKKFNLRYKVQMTEPAPREPSEEEKSAQEEAAAQAKFEALAADAPLQDWLRYTRHDQPEARCAAATQRISTRSGFVAELKAAMMDEKTELATDAMYLVGKLLKPDAALNPLVTETGRDLAQRIRKFNASTPEQDPGYHAAADADARFNAWIVAAIVLREKCQGDFIPELREILALSRVRTDSDAMTRDVRRIASYYMKEWAGVEPLAGDPPAK